MAKRAKIDHKTKVLPDISGTSAAMGSNSGPTREELLFYIGQSDGADEKIKAAQKFKKSVRQQAKLSGIDVEQMDRARKERDLNDGTTIHQLRTFQTYCAHLDLPIGAQIELFDAPQQKGAHSQEAVLKKARRTGYERGLMGLQPDEQAYPPMTEEGGEHAAGWGEGQKINHDKFLKLNEDIAWAEAAKAAKRAAKKSKDDDADEGAAEEEREMEDA